MLQGLAAELAGVMPAATGTGLFSSLCTIQTPSGTFGASGAPDGLFTNLAGAVAVPCMAAPVSHARILATETKTATEITNYRYYHVLLNGYYSVIPAGDDITPRPQLRALVDGMAYEVMGVEHDSQAQMTRLEVRSARI